jgi:hypothetical protein
MVVFVFVCLFVCLFVCFLFFLRPGSYYAVLQKLPLMYNGLMPLSITAEFLGLPMFESILHRITRPHEHGKKSC